MKIVKKILLILLCVFIVCAYVLALINTDRLEELFVRREVNDTYEQYINTKNINEFYLLINTLNKQNVEYEITIDKVKTKYISYSINKDKVSMDICDIVEEFDIFENGSINIPNENFKIFTKKEKTYICKTAQNSKNNTITISKLISKDNNLYYQGYFNEAEMQKTELAIFFEMIFLALVFIIAIILVIVIGCIVQYIKDIS